MADLTPTQQEIDKHNADVDRENALQTAWRDYQAAIDVALGAALARLTALGYSVDDVADELCAAVGDSDVWPDAELEEPEMCRCNTYFHTCGMPGGGASDG